MAALVVAPKSWAPSTHPKPGLSSPSAIVFSPAHVAMGSSEMPSVHTPCQPPSTLKGLLAGRPALPSLDDSDDIIYLDVQLVGFLKILQGPHVGGLGLGADTRHCPPGTDLWGAPGPSSQLLTSSRKSRRATNVGLSSGL